MKKKIEVEGKKRRESADSQDDKEGEGKNEEIEVEGKRGEEEGGKWLP